MAVCKDKNGTWYVSARYTNWKGEADRKLKRGFQTKKEASEWERNCFLENAGNFEMTFEAFYPLFAALRHDGQNGLIRLAHALLGKDADIGNGIIHALRDDAVAALEFLVVFVHVIA